MPRKFFFVVAFFGVHAWPLTVFAQSSPPAAAPAAVSELSVVSDYHGPRLWRISDGEHEIWLPGTIDRTLRAPDWDHRVLAKVYGEAEIVYSDAPGADLTLGPLAPLRLAFSVPGLIAAGKALNQIPDHRRLSDLLPAALYARYEAAARAAGQMPKRDSRLRPSVAARSLFFARLNQAGLRPGGLFDKSVSAARHGRPPNGGPQNFVWLRGKAKWRSPR